MAKNYTNKNVNLFLKSIRTVKYVDFFGLLNETKNKILVNSR